MPDKCGRPIPGQAEFTADEERVMRHGAEDNRGIAPRQSAANLARLLYAPAKGPIAPDDAVDDQLVIGGKCS
jgi:hypothetical protein